MRTDWTISALGHAAVLGWAVLSFGGRPLMAPPPSIAVELVSPNQLSQVAPGQKTAKKVEKPKPLVEKIAEKKVVEDPTPKVTEKKEITAAKAEQPPMPEPRPKPPEPKPAAAEPPAKTEAKAEKNDKKQPDKKVDPIAEALKKDDAKKKTETKKAEKKLPKKPVHQTPKFDPSRIAALLDKRDPQRNAAAGNALNTTASLGLASATSARLSQSELDALRARLAQLWNPPVGAKNPDELVVRIRIQLSPDGRIAAPPQVLTSGHSILFMTARESAVRALFRGQPFDMLLPEHYSQWKDIEITFDPRDMLRG